jgi:hypothetical protein
LSDDAAGDIRQPDETGKTSQVGSKECDVGPAQRDFVDLLRFTQSGGLAAAVNPAAFAI